MSCLNPISILNPSKRFSACSDKFLFDVPCGRCLSCQQSIQDDWFVRSYFQVLDTEKNGGVSYMVTLTYNDNSLPHFGDFLNFDDITTQSCFCKDDVVTFLDNLRHICRRTYNVHFKYIICSEYGDNTKRPHYHAIFHLDSHIKPWEFLNCVRCSWSHGFVFMSKNRVTNSYSIDGHFACSYVSKYVTKDMNFFDMPLIKSYCDDSQTYKHIKPYCPFHMQSQGYGLALLDIVKPKLVTYSRSGIRVGLRDQLYNIPRIS